MAFDSPRIFSSCYFRSLSPEPFTRGLLHFDVCLLFTRLFRLLPRTLSLCGAGNFDFGSLHIFLTLFFPSEITSMAFLSLYGSSSRHLLLPLPPLFRLYFRGSLHPCCFQRSLPILSLTCPPALLCCSMGNTGNHGEQVCDIHGDLAVVRYEQCLCLFACGGFNWWRDIFESLQTVATFLHRF